MLNIIEENIKNRLNKIGNTVLSLIKSFVMPKIKAVIKDNKDNIPKFFRGLMNPKKDGNVLYSIPNIIIIGNNNCISIPVNVLSYNLNKFNTDIINKHIEENPTK